MNTFTRSVVKAKDVMVDDWIMIGEALFRVIDAGHVRLDVTKIDHTLLMLQSFQDAPVSLAQLLIGLDEELVIMNQE